MLPLTPIEFALASGGIGVVGIVLAALEKKGKAHRVVRSFGIMLPILAFILVGWLLWQLSDFFL